MLSVWLSNKLTNSLLGILLTILVYLYSKTWYKNRRKNSLLEKIPSPGGILHIRDAIPFLTSANPPEAFDKASNGIKHDGLFRLTLFSKPYVIMSKPEYLKTFYLGKHTDRSDFYEPLLDAIGDAIFTASGEKWKYSRKLVVTNFFNIPPPLILSTFQKNAKKMIAHLYEKEKVNRQLTMLHVLQVYAGDSLWERVYGRPMTEDARKVVRYDMCYLIKIMYWRVFSPLYYFKPIFQLTPLSWEFYKRRDNARHVIENSIKKFMAEKEKMGKNFNPPVCALANIAASGDKHLLEDLTANMTTLIPAGIDTSTETMGFTLTMLGIHPDVAEKVFQEDREINEKLDGRDPTVDDLSQYVYLEMVIKETLRLFSCGPLLGRTLNEDTYFGNYLVPAGTGIVALQQTICYDPTIFPNPLKFDPERFSDENSAKIPPHAFHPFSAGPRGCPGVKYAYLSMKTVLSNIVRNFKIHPMYKTMDEVQQNIKFEMTLRDKNSFQIRLEPRNMQKQSHGT